MRCSAVRHASAWTVSVGLWAPLVPMTDAPSTPRFGTSCENPHRSTTFVSGLSPIRVPPYACVDKLIGPMPARAIQRAGIGPMSLSTHAYGGTRMGDNPETNVVDRWGFSHEVPNLGVLGASVMGTSGAHNPTLTVQALAWRTAEHLIKNWKGKN